LNSVNRFNKRIANSMRIPWTVTLSWLQICAISKPAFLSRRFWPWSRSDWPDFRFIIRVH